MKPEDKAVVQQALAVMQRIESADGGGGFLNASQADQLEDAITALRQLLERTEPVQEPVEMREVLVKIARFLNVVQVYAQDIPPKNEIETDKPLHWKARELQDEVIRRLDTTPPAQPAAWVGLTDDDWQQIADETDYIIWSTLKQAIEAKLKEKNNG